ncbi:MAG: penicillin-binding protein 2, partial [Armatimonadota bacterium]
MRLSEKDLRRIQKLRINILAAVMTLFFLILISRLWFLQLAQGDMLQKQSEANRIKLLRSRAPRGTVLDRANKILATSRPQFVVMAVPEIVQENKEALHTLSAILQISPQDLIDIMEKGKERPCSPTRIAVDVPLEIVARIGELRMKMPGVSVDLDHIRDYPYGTSVAHVIGYLGEINKDEMEAAKEKGIDYNLGDYIGKFGLEKQYEQYLRGIDGGKKIEVNAFGRVVKILGDKPYERGKTLKLHIDRDLQIAAQRAFGDRVGA